MGLSAPSISLGVCSPRMLKALASNEQMVLRIGLISFFVIAGTINSLFLNLSKMGEKDLPYAMASVSASVEFLKLLFASVLLPTSALRANGTSLILEDFRSLEWKSFLLYAVPAILYAIENNIGILLITFFSIETLQILRSLKIVVIGIFLRVFLKKTFSGTQYASLFLLGLGTAVNHLGCETHSSQLNSNPVGFVLLGVTLLCSASAGVYTEHRLKNRFNLSLHLQNMQLYLWGFLCNILILVIIDPFLLLSGGFFHGWNMFTVSFVFTNSVIGITVSIIFKYLDNIAEAFAATLTMFSVSFAAMVFLSFVPSFPFLISLGIVSTSIGLYYSAVPVDLTQQAQLAERYIASAFQVPSLEITRGRFGARETEPTEIDETEVERHME